MSRASATHGRLIFPRRLASLVRSVASDSLLLVSVALSGEGRAGGSCILPASLGLLTDTVGYLRSQALLPALLAACFPDPNIYSQIGNPGLKNDTLYGFRNQRSWIGSVGVAVLPHILLAPLFIQVWEAGLLDPKIRLRFGVRLVGVGIRSVLGRCQVSSRCGVGYERWLIP